LRVRVRVRVRKKLLVVRAEVKGDGQDAVRRDAAVRAVEGQLAYGVSTMG
jgi:hypothetical protein